MGDSEEADNDVKRRGEGSRSVQAQSKEERTGEKKRKKCTGVRASTHLVAALWAEKRDVVEAAAG